MGGRMKRLFMCGLHTHTHKIVLKKGLISPFSYIQKIKDSCFIIHFPSEMEKKYQVMRRYPKKRNGDEYYPRFRGHDFIFVLNDKGAQVYARDRKGNEIYPPSKKKTFARDASGQPFYAKNAVGDEFYPLGSGDGSVFITDPADDHTVISALCADGTEKYPTDRRGNEYYPRENGRPLLMKKNTGERYLAKSRNGHSLIPWNYLHEYVGEEPCVFSRDSAGNTVYVKESAFPSAYQAIIRCVCNLSVICPKVTGCHTRFY